MASNTANRPDRQYTSLFRNIFRKVFLEDWLMKLVALVITFALWVGVTGLSQPTVQRMSGIPLTLRLSNNVEVTNSPIQEVDVVISGDKRRIDQINKNDLIVSVDLTDVLPGDRVVQLSPENVSISLPTGIKLDEIQPRRIAVKLEPVEEKEVTVNPVTDGQLPEGYELYGTPAITPAKVRVRGPANLVRSLASVTTEKIDLSDKTADFTARQVSVNVSNPKTTLLETLVDVSFRIGERRVEKTFSVPVAGDPRRRVNVVLYGGRSLFEGITAEDLSVEMRKEDSGAETPIVNLPSSLVDRVEIRRPKADR